MVTSAKTMCTASPRRAPVSWPSPLGLRLPHAKALVLRCSVAALLSLANVATAATSVRWALHELDVQPARFDTVLDTWLHAPTSGSRPAPTTTVLVRDDYTLAFLSRYDRHDPAAVAALTEQIQSLDPQARVTTLVLELMPELSYIPMTVQADDQVGFVRYSTWRCHLTATEDVVRLLRERAQELAQQGARLPFLAARMVDSPDQGHDTMARFLVFSSAENAETFHHHLARIESVSSDSGRINARELRAKLYSVRHAQGTPGQTALSMTGAGSAWTALLTPPEPARHAPIMQTTGSVLVATPLPLLEPASDASAPPSGDAPRVVDTTTLGERVAAAAQLSVAREPRYDASYVVLGYPGGDPGWERGASVDVVIRALRTVGIDLQQRVRDDMLAAPTMYDQHGTPDTNIAHRRVRNLYRYFKRRALWLTEEHGEDHGIVANGDEHPTEWRPGDLVFWDTNADRRPDHVGIVASDRRAGGPWIIHHFQAIPPFTGLPRAENVLDFWPVVGHARLREDR